MDVLKDQNYLERAIALAREGMEQGHGGPFGSVIVLDDVVIGEGYNEVIATNDPTAHAEIVAIRNACKHLGVFQLTGATIYTSCEPCPMCLGAIYWARPDKVVYANTRDEAASINFDDAFIYNEIKANMQDRTIPFIHMPHPAASIIFHDWRLKEGKVRY